MWDRVEKLMKEKHLKISDLSRGSGVPYSTFTDWKAGRYQPKADKLIKIADFLGVSYPYLIGLTDEETLPSNTIELNSVTDRAIQITEESMPYYEDETAEIAQEIFENKDLHILFDAARDSKPEDLQMAADLLKRLKATNPEG